MNTISRLLLACATVTFAAIQADAGEFLVAEADVRVDDRATTGAGRWSNRSPLRRS